MHRVLRDDNLRTHVVWVPMLGGEQKHVSDAVGLVPDRRATHYWDDGGRMMRGYAKTLALPEDAWDIYMVYGPTARWDGEVPPQPDFWMHQLGTPSAPRVKAPYLDAKELAKRVAVSLGTQSAEGGRR